MVAAGAQFTTQEAKQSLQRINEQNRAFYSDRRGIGALKDLQQTFPHPWLYVAELLQNAIDEGATRISVSIAEDQNVNFEHNGKAFSLSDVEALCARGVSSKGANTVGFMGVGFKSVFRSFEHVQVSSGPWRFAFTVPIRLGEEYGDQQRDWLGAVLPIWEGSPSTPSVGMTCRFILSRRLPDLPPPEEDLSRILGESKTLLPLLAWRGVQELVWNGTRWLLKLEESVLEDHGAQVTLQSTDEAEKRSDRWILFARNYQPSGKAIARFLEHRQLSPAANEKEQVYKEAGKRRQVAAFCQIDSSGIPVPLDRGSAFAMLPTGVTFPLGLHVQADWLLVVTRREMMQMEGNQWHEEILQQIPRLIRYYLQWFVKHTSSERGWNKGYDALPGTPVPDLPSDPWFGSSQFVDAVKAELEQLEFLPALQNGRIVFIAPTAARFLPKPFARELESPESRPDVLFGNRIISNRTLGTRAKQCLDNLNLVTELSSGELSLYWNGLAVKRWLALFPDDIRNRKLVVVLEALSGLDEQNDWRGAPLICLPTATGGWDHRGALSRYPADWNIFAQEDEIRQALEPLLGSPEAMIAWDFDAALQQTRSSALSYLDDVPRRTLEEVATQWWEQLPERPSEQQINIVISLTAWVLSKQPQRKRLIQKVLCSKKNKRLLLRPNAESALVDPYAGAWRRVFFESTPAISAIYENRSPTISRADWRAFFENLTPSPIGIFYLSLSGQQMSRLELSKFAKGYAPPTRRSSWLTIDWRGLSVQSTSYTVVDACLPPPLATILESSVTREQSIAISQWLGESPSFLPGYRSVQVAYIPYMYSSVQTERLPNDAKWVESLRKACWIYSKTGDGPFAPSDVLASEDPARPNAPVAEVPIELVQTLQSCGIQFGSALPDAPAIDRLRIQGPTSSADELFELLQGAIDEAGEDDNKKELLHRILKERDLFVLPPGWNSIDGTTRVTHGRLVRSDRPRSLLGNWLVAIDSFTENAPERKALELAASFSSVPRSAVFMQVLDFLSWVWNTMPDADRVRRILPRAYAYVREDLQADNTLRALWTERLSTARVFVQHKRRWVPTNEDDLFFDDVNEAALEGLLASVDVVTAGHFGDTLVEQVAVAHLLGVKLLSSRFEVNLEPREEQTLPALWQLRFSAIQGWLRLQLKNDLELDAELDVNAVPQQDFRLTLWGVLRIVVSELGTRIQESEVKAAAWTNSTIAVSGMPGDFAEELCKVLFNQWGLRFRRDLVDLVPRVAIQLTRIGDSQFAITQLAQNTTKTPNQHPASKEQIPKPAASSQENGSSSAAEPTEAQKGQAGHDERAAEEEPTQQQTTDEVEPGGSYTDDTREARLRALIAKKKDLERRIQDSLTVEISPADEIDPEERKTGEFRADDVYREAALKYEEQCGRCPIAKSATQSGHDIDSYTNAPGHPDRKLIRRIEVKGRSLLWDATEIVEMSDIQFRDALNQAVNNGELIAPDFDYWLYVVERCEDGKLKVLPLRNVAQRAARFALKGGSWRFEAEHCDSE